MNYKVTKDDLIGDIKGFPIEIVHKMVEYQVEQGNNADVTVFQNSITSGKLGCGFRWNETEEGTYFWNDVINNENFDLFFKKYPKDGVSDNKEEKRKHGNLLVLSFFSTILFSLLLFVCLNTEYVSKDYNVIIIKIIHVIFITLAIIVSASVLYKNIKEIYTNKNK